MGSPASIGHLSLEHPTKSSKTHSVITANPGKVFIVSYCSLYGLNVSIEAHLSYEEIR